MNRLSYIIACRCTLAQRTLTLCPTSIYPATGCSLFRIIIKQRCLYLTEDFFLCIYISTYLTYSWQMICIFRVKICEKQCRVHRLELPNLLLLPYKKPICYCL